MKSVNLFIAFDNFVTFFPTSERKLLPVANPFDTYDEMRFRERYWMSKSVVQCLMDDVNVANIDSKTARTVSHEPINRTAKERRSKYTTLTDSWDQHHQILFWDLLHISETNRARKLKFGTLVGIYEY